MGLEDYVSGVRAGDRATLGRAITLIESTNPEHQALAAELLTALMPHTGGAWRVGITGVPGVGKSTFIDALGTRLTSAGRRVAVLAVDPSSSRTGGSILGDKTRMERLSVDPSAFIRPSPSSGTLGGVAAHTRETLLLCEAAGFDVVLVETVGVGQSETLVAEMTDFFLALMLAGAGDELQGIKRGLLELADLIAVNKADGDNAAPARRAAHGYRSALHFTRPQDDWTPPVLTCSAIEDTGLEEIWAAVGEHRAQALSSGRLAARRRRQALRWMWDLVDDQLRLALRAHLEVKARLPALEQQVAEGQIAPTTAARRLLASFLGPAQG
ncbi:MAG: methylmalonyl Co-A mutase-associated GTPase MeaB [Alphaproteobacteria bacterium]|nr:methylmalonyl Co-A mutase-associated GTPase MeaB [Alphaproteobacteria bacterium]MCB9796779.1 methylmalonyl Co-A mutase-associated GTPase MeaB [Alphaproteobacteria bacterium]